MSLLPGTVRSVAPTLCASAIKGLCSSIGSAILPLAKTESGGWRSNGLKLPDVLMAALRLMGGLQRCVGSQASHEPNKVHVLAQSPTSPGSPRRPPILPAGSIYQLHDRTGATQPGVRASTGCAAGSGGETAAAARRLGTQTHRRCARGRPFQQRPRMLRAPPTAQTWLAPPAGLLTVA